MSKLARVELIVIHHSASSRSTTAADIDRWHRAKGWDGIGYHCVIEEDGKIVEGRDLQDFPVGAHAMGVNQRSVGVCVVGDNRFPEKAWAVPQVVSLRRWVDAALLVFGMERDTVVGHRDAGTTVTACPGMTTEALHRRLWGVYVGPST